MSSQTQYTNIVNWHIFTKVLTYAYKQLKHMSNVWSSSKIGWEKWHMIILNYKKLNGQQFMEKRHTCATPYFMNIFIAEIYITQQSENINKYFQSCVNSYTSLNDFVKKYKDVVMRQHHQEKELDSRMNNAVEPTSTRLPLELHLWDTFK